MPDINACKALLVQAIGKLGPSVTDAAIHALEIASNARDILFIDEYINDPKKWRVPPVSFDTFIDSKEYLGVGDKIYPEIRHMAKSLVEGHYSESVIVAGIGSGKTTTAELVECYMAHLLLCMRDPYKTYGLAKDKPIALINMGTTATQALEVAFAGVKSFIQGSPWFQSKHPHANMGTIKFADNNILLISGNSKSTTPLGYNIFYAVLDEAAFYIDNDNNQVAEDIYTALQRRIVSRFGREGMCVMISSPRYEGDFIMSKLEEAAKFPDIIYARQMPTWKCKPVPKNRQDVFYFNSRTSRIVDALEPTDAVTKLEEPFDRDATFWEIPGEYKKSFQQDPEKAKRDFAAIPSSTIEAFMPSYDLIEAMFTTDESPVQPNGAYKFADRPLRANYYIHIDLGLNRKGKGDHAGFAMGHFGGWDVDEITGERQKRVVIDLAEQIGAGPTGEVRFEDIRNKIYALKKSGYNVKLVTLDSFQSADTVQILRSKSIRAEILSVDREALPYQTLKELIYSQRISSHKMPVLERELKMLEISKSQKIDHPPKGSKDVADAVCGVAYSVIENTSNGEIGMAVGDLGKITSLRDEPSQLTPSGAPVNLNERRKHYEDLQDMLDNGML